MEKLIYLAKVAPGHSSDAIRRAVIDTLVPQLGGHGAYRVTVHLADMDEAVSKDAPKRLNPSWGSLAAGISFWLDNLDTRFAIESTIGPITPSYHGYLVTESVVLGLERSWKNGERRPGITMLTCTGKPANVSDEDFYYWWQIKHSELSFRIHPHRSSYVRNAVARSLTPDAPAYRSIVCEHWQDYADYVDDDRFMDKSTVPEMLEELPYFCDRSNMISGPMSEYSFD